MSVVIVGIDKKSLAEKLNIVSGDVLFAINGNDINDILDYRFYETESRLVLELASAIGEKKEVTVKKRQYEPLGLNFSTYLMDSERSCKNKCVFCFIDQLPKGMRKSLYFKDDDDRLSFIFGNYITLTNIDEKEIDRIIKMHISPVNVSVHTMNPKLRAVMMNNRFAGEALKFIPQLTEAGIRVNGQLVLCPGINDGDELEFSLTELQKLGENLQSVACVPVGLSKYREGLFKLRPYTKKEASMVIDTIEKYGNEFKKQSGERTCYPSDEFYLIAERELPPYDFYEDFPQIENGVGMFRNLEEEFLFAIEEGNLDIPLRHITVITGTRIHGLLNKLIDELRKKCDNLQIELVSIKNEFFGGSVDVTGLITGSDIIAALKGKQLYDELILPDVMLKADEDIFLDDVTFLELSEKLNINIKKVGSSGLDLFNALTNN